MSSVLDTARAIVEAGKTATPGPWRKRQLAGHPEHECFVEALEGRKPYAQEVLSDEPYLTKAADCQFIAISRSADRVAEALLLAREVIKAVDEADDTFTAEVACRGVKDFLADLEKEIL